MKNVQDRINMVLLWAIMAFAFMFIWAQQAKGATIPELLREQLYLGCMYTEIESEHANKGKFEDQFWVGPTDSHYAMYCNCVVRQLEAWDPNVNVSRQDYLINKVYIPCTAFMRRKV